MKKDDCIFCKIAAGEIPSRKIYEDSDLIAIMDLNPTSKGHSLIIPKEHCTNIYDIDEDIAAKVMKTAKKLATKMTVALNCDGFNLLQNNGETAGQTMFHFHMHLIPRYKGDQVGITWHPGELNDADKEEILLKVKEQLS